MDKTVISQRIARAIDESGKSMSEIGRELGISPQSVRAWKIGKNIPDVARFTALAKATGRTVAWLQGDGDDDAPIIISKDEIEIVEDAVTIPVFDAAASAGLGTTAFEGDQVIKRMVVDRHWLKDNMPSYSSTKNLSVITVRGDSMCPTLEDGDWILVDTGVNTLKYDAIYVAALNGDLYVKRFQKNPNGGLRMISDNKAYDPFDIEPTAEINIIGKVIYHWHGGRV